jgi:hypothetical protein
VNLRDKILNTTDIPSEMLSIPEWNVEILVKGMSAGDRLHLQKISYDQESGQVLMEKMYPDIVVSCCYDPETGEPIFTDDDKDAILAKSSAAVEKIAEVGLRLSGLGKDSQDEAGKGSSPTPNDDSSSS